MIYWIEYCLDFQANPQEKNRFCFFATNPIVINFAFEIPSKFITWQSSKLFKTEFNQFYVFSAFFIIFCFILVFFRVSGVGLAVGKSVALFSHLPSETLQGSGYGRSRFQVQPKNPRFGPLMIQIKSPDDFIRLSGKFIHGGPLNYACLQGSLISSLSYLKRNQLKRKPPTIWHSCNKVLTWGGGLRDPWRVFDFLSACFSDNCLHE